MGQDLTAVVVCKTREDAEVYRELLEKADLICSIVETDEYTKSTSYEVSVAESDYDDAFKVIEKYEEG